MSKKATLDLLLKGFSLSTMRETLAEVTTMAQHNHWDYPEFLQELCERERQVRDQRRLVRLLKQSALPEGKTLATLKQDKLGACVRKQMSALLEGDFVDRGANVLAFGLPGRGKTHCLCAIARELILKQQRSVWFTPTFKLVQQLLKSKETLQLEGRLKKLDRFELIILDDIGYVQHTRAEMEVLFSFLAERYERKSLMITSNLPFSQWEQIFHDPMTAMAAIDRLVHHSTIMEFGGESFRVHTNKPQ